MKRSSSVAIALLAIGLPLTRGTASHADSLQGSATSTSVATSFTLSSAQFFSPDGAVYSTGVTFSGAIAGQSFNLSSGGSLFTPHSGGPTQITDAATASTARSAASVTGAMNGAQTMISVSTGTFAFASSAYSATAEASGGTTPPARIPVPPFSQSTAATLDIDLMSDFGSNANSAYSLQTFALGSPGNTHSSQIDVSTDVRSTIPGNTSLFSLSATLFWNNGVVTGPFVSFSSSVIAQPIFASDFIAGPNHSFSLDPNKRHVTIPFTIPASASGFQFSVGTDTRVIIVPEPSTLAIGSTALLLAATAWRKRRSIRSELRAPLKLRDLIQ